MPSILSNYASEKVNLTSSDDSPYDPPYQKPQEISSLHSTKPSSPLMKGHSLEELGGNKCIVDGVFLSGPNGMNPSLQSLPNGRSSGSIDSRDKLPSRNDTNIPLSNGNGVYEDHRRQSAVSIRESMENGTNEQASLRVDANLDGEQLSGPKSPENTQHVHRSGHARAHSASAPQRHIPQTAHFPATDAFSTGTDGTSTVQKTQLINRLSSPPILPIAHTNTATSSTSSLYSGPPRLRHRHTLQVPKISTTRNPREPSSPTVSPSADAADEGERFSPTNQGLGRISVSLGRRPTRSLHSDMHVDEIPPDDDTARWTETIRQKRASRKQRKEEEEDDRVVVGTKVDMNHVNWVTAYNMLTGIRFTVSRTNAKMDRDLTDADFDAKHKFSFDITGNELTPSAKYDFKFKDYAPWVFRHLRARFMLDPADYLMSLTSKYILSELGSPGKSGSFFYFSRDYKYIIKTIHHAEHKLLRKILREYYVHIEKNPNTLISQFYGLHRVKIPYGRKIHFVVMNNLFPPHRDIHQTFDLKGSTVGRELKEEELERNPRATLKDQNWLRRNYHFEFGPGKKERFIDQVRRDVALLQRLKIMDYSLLVGIHDMSKGNEENLRDKTLQVFQPGGERSIEPRPNMLLRTPSKVETARKAKELRQIIKREKPVPMDKSTNMLPDEIVEERKDFIFYRDDGGFRASHEDGQPGEEIYYLGIIDCLTHYGFVKRAEHLWKGMSNNKSQISPIPPDGYGERFVRFITSTTMTREEAERGAQSSDQDGGASGVIRQFNRTSTDKTIRKSEQQARKPVDEGASEDASKDRTLSAGRSPSNEKPNVAGGATLPIVEEAGEAGSREDSVNNEKPSGSIMPSEENPPSLADQPPPTPLKDLAVSPAPSREPTALPPMLSQDLTTAPPPPSKDATAVSSKAIPSFNKELPSIPVLPRLSMSEALNPSFATATTTTGMNL